MQFQGSRSLRAREKDGLPHLLISSHSLSEPGDLRPRGTETHPRSLGQPEPGGPVPHAPPGRREPLRQGGGAPSLRPRARGRGAGPAPEPGCGEGRPGWGCRLRSVRQGSARRQPGPSAPQLPQPEVISAPRQRRAGRRPRHGGGAPGGRTPGCGGGAAGRDARACPSGAPRGVGPPRPATRAAAPG